MKRRVAKIGPAGAAVTAVVGSVLLSLLILAPSPGVPLPGGAPPVGRGHVGALVLPRPRVQHSHVHRLQSAPTSAPAPSAAANSRPQAPIPAHHAHVSKPAATTPATTTPATTTPATTTTPTTPAAATHVPGSKHHGKPDWAAHPHGNGAESSAQPTHAHPAHPVHPAHPGRPDHPAHHGNGHHGNGRKK
jgi:hypothetical protein